jgi:hypothetical protein
MSYPAQQAQREIPGAYRSPADRIFEILTPCLINEAYKRIVEWKLVVGLSDYALNPLSSHESNATVSAS